MFLIFLGAENHKIQFHWFWIFFKDDKLILKTNYHERYGITKKSKYTDFNPDNSFCNQHCRKKVLFLMACLCCFKILEVYFKKATFNIYSYSNINPRLSHQNCNFFLLSIPKRDLKWMLGKQHKMSWNPQSHDRILILISNMAYASINVNPEGGICGAFAKCPTYAICH